MLKTCSQNAGIQLLALGHNQDVAWLLSSIGGSRGATGTHALADQFLIFFMQFLGRIDLNNNLWVAPHPSGKSWIRYCRKEERISLRSLKLHALGNCTLIESSVRGTQSDGQCLRYIWYSCCSSFALSEIYLDYLRQFQVLLLVIFPTQYNNRLLP